MMVARTVEGLPPLNPLRAFDAAGRLQSIRLAAEELSVTPGAVSRQVQALEALLGVRLFRREPREVVLRAEGSSIWRRSANTSRASARRRRS